MGRSGQMTGWVGRLTERAHEQVAGKKWAAAGSPGPHVLPLG